MAKLGIDLDGVCYDFDKVFNEYLRHINWFDEHFVADPGPEFVPPQYDWYKSWGMTTQEFVDIGAQGVDDGFIFIEGEPFDGCVKALNLLKAEGHTIHIVTHRTFGKKAVHNTADWIHKYEIPFDTITFAEDKTLVGVDILLDDYEMNWRASLAEGIPCVIMDRPWNEHVHEAERVFGWSDFVSYVDKFSDVILDEEIARFFGV